MADPFMLSTQYQDRLDSASKSQEELPRYVMEGMKIPGIISQNRILSVRAKEAQNSLTVSEQLQKSVQNPHGLMAEFGELKTAKDMRMFMAKYSAIAVSPVGQNLLGVFDKIADVTEKSELNSIQRIGEMAEAKHLAELSEKYPGLQVFKNPDHRVIAQGNESLKQLATEARLEGLRPDGLTRDLLDPDTGTIDPAKAAAWHDSLNPSAAITSRYDIALEQIASREQMAQELADLRRDLMATTTAAGLEGLKLRMENNIEVQELRNEARIAITEGQVSREQFINRQLNQTATRIAASKEGRKMTPEAVNEKAMKLLGESFDQEISSKRPSSGQSGTSSKEKRRTTKDGRTAIFDSDSKEFLRYADE